MATLAHLRVLPTCLHLPEWPPPPPLLPPPLLLSS